MLHSGHVAAKLLSGNELKTPKVHFVGAGWHEVSPILWSNPQIHLSSLLILEAHDKLIGTGMVGRRHGRFHLCRSWHGAG
jgi:hypothetical protein